MSRGIKIILALIVLIVVGVIVVTQINKPKETPKDDQANSKPQDEQLRIIKTNPDPLNEATILPTQSIEIIFNRVIPKSEFKHQFDPEIKDYQIEAIGGADATKGSTIKINFKNPLQLGGGYTLKIFNSTRTDDNKNLDKEYEYHFKTIQYKGV